MRWIIEYWYMILAGIAVAVFILGYRTKIDQEETTGTHGQEQTTDKTHKSGHSCCH